MVGITTQPFWAMFSSFLDRYGKINPYDVQANRKQMEALWTTEPIEKLFAQINDAYEYGIFADHPLSLANMVQTAEVLVLNNGNYATEYKEWRALPPNQRTWDEFQRYWQEAYNLRQETETTAASLNFSAHTEEQVLEDDITLNDAMANFGEAFAANSTFISQLTEQNSSMNEQFTRNLSNIQEQMNAMNMAMQNLANAGNNRQQQPPRPPPQQHFFQPPPPHHNVPPTWQQSYTQPPAYPQCGSSSPVQQPFTRPPTFPQGGRGRGGGRYSNWGRGRNGGRFRQNFANYNPNYCPPAQPFQQMMYNTPPLQGQQNQNLPYSNTYKRFNNWNYCWTHGYDIGDNHNSSNCLRPAQGHVWHATRQNPCGGSSRNQHKVLNNSYNYLCMNYINTTIDDNDKTVKTSNCTKEKEENINLYDTHGLLDSRTTDNVLTITSNYSNV